MTIISGWAYEGAIHCNDCATKHFGGDLWAYEKHPMSLDYIECVFDREGNKVTPFFSGDMENFGEPCDDCRERCC